MFSLAYFFLFFMTKTMLFLQDFYIKLVVLLNYIASVTIEKREKTNKYGS